MGLFVVRGCQQLVPAIALNPKLLLCGAYFPGSVGVEVGLLELLNEFLDPGGGILDERLLSFESGCDDGAGVDPDGPVEVVVAVLELLDEGDRLLVGRTELAPHWEIYRLSIWVVGKNKSAENNEGGRNGRKAR